MGDPARNKNPTFPLAKCNQGLLATPASHLRLLLLTSGIDLKHAMCSCDNRHTTTGAIGRVALPSAKVAHRPGGTICSFKIDDTNSRAAIQRVVFKCATKKLRREKNRIMKYSMKMTKGRMWHTKIRIKPRQQKRTVAKMVPIQIYQQSF